LNDAAFFPAALVLRLFRRVTRTSFTGNFE
jgi:general stress protein CsbA